MSRQRQHGKHQKILKAAIKVFAEKGFYNAKVSEIAREAKVADGTIYLYFKNKDDILIRLFEEEMDGIIRTIRAEIAALKNPVEKLRVFIRTHLTMVDENPPLAEVIQVELRQSSKFMKDYENRKFQEYLDLLAEIIREGQRMGMIRPDIRPFIAKRVIFGALDEMSTVWVLSKNRGHSVPEIAAQITDILIRGVVCPGLDAPDIGALSNAQGGCHV